jgi:hypothetical protein
MGVVALVVVLCAIGYAWARSRERERTHREELRLFEFDEGNDRYGLRWSVDLQDMRLTQERYDYTGDPFDPRKEDFRLRRTKGLR